MDVFVARQPIFGADRQVRAYELLYRSSRTNVFDGLDGDAATSRLLVNAFLSLGLDTLTGGQPAFVNFTRHALLEEFPTLLPADRLVVEILETVEPDEPIVAACRELKALGYTLALDDAVELDERYEPILELADILKVDFLASTPEQRWTLADLGRRHHLALLAEKVETDEQFGEAVSLGYTRFQGYFFSHPNVVCGRDVPPARINYLRLLQEVNRPQIDLDRVELVIKGELALSYKLLRYLNSAAFNWRRKISSIRHALVAIGERELRKWMSVLCLTQMAEDKPPELVLQSIVRANFCESMAHLVGLLSRSTDLFLTGLFSMLDAIMDRPLPACLEDVPIATDVRQALLQHEGSLAPVLAGVSAYERGNWDEVRLVAQHLGVPPERIPETYLAAVQRADAVFAAT